MAQSSLFLMDFSSRKKEPTQQLSKHDPPSYPILIPSLNAKIKQSDKVQKTMNKWSEEKDIVFKIYYFLLNIKISKSIINLLVVI